MPAIDFNIHNRIGILTVNRPEVRNALDWEAMTAFAAAVDQAWAAADLAALLITGSGKAFISGGDVAERSAYTTEADAVRMNTLMGNALDRLAALPCLTLAAMEGPARGGGCEVALACDWRVAAEDADLGFVQIRLGLTTGWGGAARLAQLIGYAPALDLLLLGRVVTAPEAYRLGLVTHLAPPDEALKSAISIADAVTQYDPAVVRAYKRILKAAQPALAEAQSIERAEFPKLWAAETHLNAVKKFLEKE